MQDFTKPVDEYFCKFFQMIYVEQMVRKTQRPGCSVHLPQVYTCSPILMDVNGSCAEKQRLIHGCEAFEKL
ncbi:hypothetical protein INR49_031824 [Caranx melampygus]|nr:hypothetical protein INR49_031824 [Caranx melampygus]